MKKVFIKIWVIKYSKLIINYFGEKAKKNTNVDDKKVIKIIC